MSKSAKETKYTRKSVEERIAEIDRKIEYHKEYIQKLEEKKQAALNPVKPIRKPTQKRIDDSFETLRRAGYSEEAIEALKNSL